MRRSTFWKRRRRDHLSQELGGGRSRVELWEKCDKERSEKAANRDKMESRGQKIVQMLYRRRILWYTRIEIQEIV